MRFAAYKPTNPGAPEYSSNDRAHLWKAQPKGRPISEPASLAYAHPRTNLFSGAIVTISTIFCSIHMALWPDPGQYRKSHLLGNTDRHHLACDFASRIDIIVSSKKFVYQRSFSKFIHLHSLPCRLVVPAYHSRSRPGLVLQKYKLYSDGGRCQD